MYSPIAKCRICGNDQLEPILDLGCQALTGVFPKPGDHVEVGPLELVRCAGKEDVCGLVQLRHSFSANSLYGDTYGYRSGLNSSMVAHLRAIAATAKKRVSLQPGDVILDIGSNDSTLLQALDEPGMQLVGMDPSGLKFSSFYPSHIQIIPDFFSASRFRRHSGYANAKIIASIAMFYDLESPLGFMRDIYDILTNDGIWIFEQSYLPMMLATTSYDTVCHEHLEYYALEQIIWMTKAVGFNVIDVHFNQINGGSFVVTAAKQTSGLPVSQSQIADILAEEHRLGLKGQTVYQNFRDRVYAHRRALTNLLARLAERGQTVIGYGASTKGNVLLQFCNLTSRDVPFIAEINPDKFGHLTPSTLIPIIPEAEARAMKPAYFMVLPWHFRDSIIPREAEYLAAGGRLLFPLPKLEVVSAQGTSHHDL